MTYYIAKVTDKQKVAEGGGVAIEGEMIETFEVVIYLFKKVC